MNVNAAIKGVGVRRLQTSEPDDACDDRIATGRIGLKNLTSETPLMKNRTRGSVVTDFFGDL